MRFEDTEEIRLPPRPSYGYRQSQMEMVSFNDYFKILRKRWLLIFFTTLLFFGGGVLYTSRQPRVYRASALVAAASLKSHVIGNVQVEEGYRAPNPHLIFQRVIQSRYFRKKILDRLPDATCLALFGKRQKDLDPDILPSVISGYSQRDTNFLIINCDSQSAKHCAKAANVVANVFVLEVNKSSGSAQNLLQNWIKKEIPEIEREMLENSELLLKFEENNMGVLFIAQEKGGGYRTPMIDRIQSELQETRIKLLIQEARYKKCVQARKRKTIKALLVLDFLEGNELVDSLREKQHALESEYHKLRSKYNPKHPRMVILKKSIESAKKKVLEEADISVSRQIQIYLGLKNTYEKLKKMLSAQQRENLKLKKKLLQYERYRRKDHTLQKKYTAFIEKGQGLDTASKYEIENLKILNLAQTPSFPYRPSKFKNYTLSVFLGLLIGIGLAFLFEQVDESVKKITEVEQIISKPLLGVIHYISPKVFPGPFTHIAEEREKSHIAEAFRTISTSILFSAKKDSLQSFVISSPIAGDGKSTVLCNLGFSIAKAGHKVLLVDGDLHRPVLHKNMELKKQSGFSELLQQQTSLQEVVQRVRHNLWCIPAGKIPKDPYDCISNSPLEEILQQMQEEYDYVFIDAPPAGITSDGFLLSKAAGSLLLVVALRHTSKKILHQLNHRLYSLEAPLKGFIVNNKYEESSEYVSNLGYYGNYSAHPDR